MRIQKRRMGVAIAWVIAIGLTPSSVAATDEELLRMLLGNGAITQDQYEQLLEKEKLTTKEFQEIEVSGGENPGTFTDLQPSLYIFTEGYYSMMFVPGADPRPEFQGGVQGASDEDIKAAFMTFVANSGTYEVSGSTLTRNILLARVPTAMGVTNEWEYSVDGDTLIITATNANTGVVTRTTLRRLE